MLIPWPLFYSQTPYGPLTTEYPAAWRSSFYWSNYDTKTFMPLRPFMVDSIPRPFRISRPCRTLSDITYPDSLTSPWRTLTDSSFRPSKPQGQTLMYNTFKPLADSSYKTFCIQDIPCGPSLMPQVWMLNCPTYNLIYLTNLLTYSKNALHNIYQ